LRKIDVSVAASFEHLTPRVAEAFGSLRWLEDLSFGFCKCGSFQAGEMLLGLTGRRLRRLALIEARCLRPACKTPWPLLSLISTLQNLQTFEITAGSWRHSSWCLEAVACGVAAGAEELHLGGSSFASSKQLVEALTRGRVKRLSLKLENNPELADHVPAILMACSSAIDVRLNVVTVPGSSIPGLQLAGALTMLPLESLSLVLPPVSPGCAQLLGELCSQGVFQYLRRLELSAVFSSSDDVLGWFVKELAQAVELRELCLDFGPWQEVAPIEGLLRCAVKLQRLSRVRLSLWGTPEACREIADLLRWRQDWDISFLLPL